MSEPGMRPGGLTALAIISFIWALIQLIGGGFTLMMPATMPFAVEMAEKDAASSHPSPKAEANLKDVRHAAALVEANKTFILVEGVVSILFAVMLVVAGIGYLKQKRGIGLRLGTIYAVLAIVVGIVAILYAQQKMEQPMSLFSLVGFLLPVITLLCLRVIFKDDFPNP